jgi:hypothetical protein
MLKRSFNDDDSTANFVCVNATLGSKTYQPKTAAVKRISSVITVSLLVGVHQ